MNLKVRRKFNFCFTFNFKLLSHVWEGSEHCYQKRAKWFHPYLKQCVIITLPWIHQTSWLVVFETLGLRRSQTPSQKTIGPASDQNSS